MEDVDRDNSLTIFKWAAVAKRPLTLAELREVVGIKPCQRSLNVERLINDISRATSCCGSLVEIDEEYSTIHFAHHSVKQYLLSAARDPTLSRYHFTSEEADTDAGEICVTYLSFQELTMHVARAPISQTYAKRYPFAILKENLPDAGLASRAALKILKNRHTPNYSFHRQLEESIGITEVQRLQQAQRHFAFLDYARTHWLAHTKALTVDSKTWQLWSDLVRKDLSTFYVSWALLEPGEYNNYGMRAIVRDNHRALLFLKISDPDFYEITDENIRKCDKWINDIILEGKYGLLRIVLSSTLAELSFLNHSSMYDDINAVLAGLGNLELLKEQAGEKRLWTNTVRLDGLLQYEIVPLLKNIIIPGLDSDSSLQAFMYDLENHKWNALAVAAALGRVHVVEYLIVVNRTSDDLRHSVPSLSDIFIQAAIRKQIKVLHVLLDQAVKYLDLNWQNASGLTPLMCVVRLGDVDLAEKLISAGAELHMRDYRGWTALSFARSKEMRDALVRARATERLPLRRKSILSPPPGPVSIERKSPPNFGSP